MSVRPLHLDASRNRRRSSAAGLSQHMQHAAAAALPGYDGAAVDQTYLDLQEARGLASAAAAALDQAQVRGAPSEGRG